jgi:hypothetical protein
MGDLRIMRGDTGDFDAYVLQIDGRTPQNVTGYRFWSTVKRRLSDPDPGLWQGFFTPPNDPNGISIQNAEQGLIRITIPAAVTEAWDVPAALYWDLQAETEAGVIRTIDRGKMFVYEDVTRAL